MSILELATDFTELCREGKSREAAEKYWAEDVVSLEAMPGENARLQGREAVFQKHQWWEDNVTYHGGSVEGPYLHGDQFALYFTMDVTYNENQKRETMQEVGIYSVKDGKIIEERFFYIND